MLAEHQIRRLPVIEERRLVGMISEADLAAHLPETKIAEFATAFTRHRRACSGSCGGGTGRNLTDPVDAISH
jgi:CBS-domain-containing membrane protein